jgi:enamine deaminase RidA (YjgF/YER057c/UK114 family)
MSADPIERVRGGATGRSSASAWRDLVYAVATAPGATVAEQTRNVLATIEKNLEQLGSGRTRLISATVYLSDLAGTKTEMDRVWDEWIGSDPAHWPQRACVQTGLAADNRVEIVVIAARD